MCSNNPDFTKLAAIRIIINHKDYVNFDANKYITDALNEHYPHDIIELLFDKGGKFILEVLVK